MIYWMARYLERAENVTRIVDVNAQLVLDLQARQGADDPAAWRPLVYVSGNDEQFFELHGDAVNERAVVDFMLFDPRNPSSVVSCIAYARENARCIRDTISSEIWEALNTLHLKLKNDSYDRYLQIGSAAYLSHLKTQIQTFYGVAASMVPRTDTWWFFELGRCLERADNTSRILDVKYYMLLPDRHGVGSALDVIQWASVLRSCSAFDAFRRSRRGQLNLERAVDFLIRDKFFPRSIRFCVECAADCLRRVSADSLATDTNPAVALADQLTASLAATDVRAVIVAGLHEHLDDIQLKIAGIHTAIVETFIEYDAARAPVIT